MYKYFFEATKSWFFQVIAFLYAAMKCVDIGLRTAMIVTPVNVLHNWKHEFEKWKPTEFKHLRVFMLDDVPRYQFYNAAYIHTLLLYCYCLIYLLLLNSSGYSFGGLSLVCLNSAVLFHNHNILQSTG